MDYNVLIKEALIWAGAVTGVGTAVKLLYEFIKFLRKRKGTEEHRLELEREKLEYQRFKDSGGRRCPNCRSPMKYSEKGNYQFYRCQTPECGTRINDIKK